MKRLILITVISLIMGTTSLAFAARAESATDIFNEFSTAPNAEYVNVNPFMMSLGRMFMGDDPDSAIIKKIKSVKVLDLENCSPTVKNNFRNKIGKLSTKGYEEMIHSSENNEKVTIYAKMDKEIIHSMLIVCTGSDDCTLVEINGKFKMEDITGVVNSQMPKHDGRR